MSNDVHKIPRLERALAQLESRVQQLEDARRPVVIRGDIPEALMGEIGEIGVLSFQATVPCNLGCAGLAKGCQPFDPCRLCREAGLYEIVT